MQTKWTSANARMVPWPASKNATNWRQLGIATASVDYTTRIWDAASAKEIAFLRGHEDWVNSVAFSPDGSRIVTASADSTARIWDAHLETMSVRDLVTEAYLRLAGLTKLTRDEMRLAGYPDSVPEIDVRQ
jgi:WD40 repeat protein